MAMPKRAPSRWQRLFTPARRVRFIEQLRTHGNVAKAAQEIGVPAGALYRMRYKDEALAAEWSAAVEAAGERLAAAEDAFPGEDPGCEVIRKAANGRFQLAAARPGQWTASLEAAFLDRLRQTGNIAGAARSLGFDPSSVWERREKWPAFARAWEQALDDASTALEFRLATYGNDLVAGEGGGGQADRPPEPFDPEFALKFLRWYHDKKSGRGRRGHGPREMTATEAKAIILKRIEAIERHRAREAQRLAEPD